MKKIINKNFLIFMILTFILIFSSLNCKTEPDYEWFELSEFNSGRYFTSQSGSYMCGFATTCTWLKWLNKNPNYPDIDRLARWYNDNGFGKHVSDVGTYFDYSHDGIAGFPEIFYKANQDLVDFSNRIAVRPNSISGDNYYKDLRDSIMIFKQPVTVHVKNYNNDWHVMLSYGFVCNKDNMFDYGNYIKFKIIDGNRASTNGKVVYSRNELANEVQQYGYNCDMRVIGSSFPW